MMDRNREPRRGAMAAVNGGVSRRRSRSSSLRDSPEEDGATETQEAARLRDRGSKKDRDRDRSTRSKRRRGDRMVHGSHREEGEDSSEESVDDEEDDEEDDASVAVRLPALPAANMAPSASMMQSHHVRKGFPAKPARPPGTGSWKVVEEMIGAPIPRKARSSSVKRSPECWVSGGGAGGEQVHRQASTSPARPSPPSTAPVSPSSSNASVRKKMKPICGTKHRPPKTSKASSSIQEIEIEVAEVLFGMTRQVPPKQESYKHDSKESNGSGNEVKSRVSSPIPLSSLPANSQSSAMPHSLASNSTPLTTTAPKRKRPRMRFEEENPTSPPNSVALPAISTCSVAKSEKEAPPPASSAGTKTEATSAKLEKNMASPAVETGGVTSDPAASNASSALVTPDLLLEPVKPEDNSDVDPKDPEDRLEKKAKEEAVSPRANLDVNPEEPPASKAPPVSESPREEKFSIDLMAPPPGKASPERESASDFVAERKPAEMEMVPSVELTKADGEKMEKNSKTEDGGVAQDDRKTRKPVAEDYELKQPIKERNLDLQLDLEKPEKDIAGASKPQAQKQQPRAPRADSKLEKTGPSSSIPLPMQVTSWPGGFPPFGYVGQVPSLPHVSVDGSSSKTSFISSHLRPKRCATHCYIAQNIHYHQQIARLNPFWASATGAAPLYGPKQYNLNAVPSADSAVVGSSLQGSHSGRGLPYVQEKGGPASSIYSCPSGKDKNSTTNPLNDSSQRKSPMLHHSSQPGSTGNMLAPAFIFSLNQQQASSAVASNRGGNVAQSSAGTIPAAAGTSGTNGPGGSMIFNYPGLPPNEAQYLAFLQNNGYPFPIPAQVGGAPSYRGPSSGPTQAMPFFSLSFYPPHMVHPSQLRFQQQQQQPPSQQPPHPQQVHQNPSTSSGSSSSQKHTKQSHRAPAAGASATNTANSMTQPPTHHARQLESEAGSEENPSTADSRVPHTQKNIYNPKFSMPIHSQNFFISSTANQNDKQQDQKVGLPPSQAFAMSFASFNGTAAAAPHGLDFSSMAQSSLFQSLPEAARHSYQISAQLKKPEDGKPATELGNSSTVGEEGKISSANKVLGNVQQQSLEPPIPSILSNSVIDTSSRTLNLIPAPASASRVSSRPGSAASVVSNSASSATNSQQYQQALQIQKQQQLQIQHQLQLHQQQQRVKPPSSHNNTASLYPDRLPGGSIASKFPQTLAGFPPAQSPQWKASVRAPTPASSASPSPSLPSAKNQISLHQQVRAQQQTPHQTQISFSANSAKIGGGGNATSIPSSATIMIGSPQTSVAKGSGGSPRSSSGAKSGAPPTTVLPVLPFQKQQVGKNPSSPTVSQLPTTTNRNMPSILGTPNASKTQPSSSQHILLNQMPKQQHLPQAQLFFSNAYMQPQTSQSDAAVAAAAAGYFQPHQRRTTDLQSAQQQQNSTPGSTGMLSLAPSSLTLTDGGSSAPDASKATGAPPAGGSKGLTGAGLMQQHPSRFPTVSQAGSGPRIL